MNDLEHQLQAERLFEILAQIMLDVCTHIVANSNLSAPGSYADSMRKLVDLKIVEKSKLDKFTSMGRSTMGCFLTSYTAVTSWLAGQQYLPK